MGMRRRMGRGDLEPPFNPVMRNPRTGQPIDLAAADSITVDAKQNGAALFTARTAAGDINGQVVMAWEAGDTDDLGDIELEVNIEWTTGRVQTVPPGPEKYVVSIVEKVA